ncbi:MAG TPA: bifunctional demethylmenaquinone methyltransferase/2-methoxy-6-polyprenyl-1,4-benzoquinol methylase UbiE [Geminicoccus sp.]|uniref:bifunctional demethylmenaquinone methyltransferase/2-methoxy-6-polyprenyl-1,4-benzoquinol methylase UbiE n=1 Tax=Geminicoccus sp. TaxID=2024832 RepID=UPI002CDF3F3E|nr:bifunctional demethylmenaquinone methyltransferase/2-methoxy-6-polyprenyl-1,4-benzoquinol methylase UbiE [Geminicoccus sp.]HWL70554.1 bifunctional demethylmenaquinone methyltransferase/2-methoxy-6-polyprenyl-1,4-benzoquinol methylase UbiE [Geminicoccus sp.]
MKDAADELARSFGYEMVDPAEKATKVRQVFDRVAARYDLMNDLMSGGVHRLWKDALVDWLAPRKGLTHLDVAGGTGDVAFRIMDRVGGEAAIAVCDINHAMLEVGRDRAIDRGLVHGLSWVTGDAMALPFKDKSVDSYTIAFGIRNVTHIDRALGEAYRVLKPGGRFLCLEFSRLIIPQLRPIYDQYSLRMIPAMGKLVAGDAESYRYLVESIRRFPDQKTFAGLIGRAGFDLVKLRNLSGGIAAIHSGWRL